MLGALILGVSAGPASALLGFFMLDRIPEESRGSALGTQNSLLLVAAPVAVFATSVAVDTLGTSTAAVVLVGCWIAITALALVARGMRNLDDAKAPAATGATEPTSPCASLEGEAANLE